ncbi:MAG: flagellar filament capping protein FliD [Rhodobacteraceae bacterium]|nr:flagellar filament capping protein FliD [Paracoccaceae bacterium]
MAVDYLSALNTNGSGLNTTQLVDAIVTAEIAPRRNLVTKKQEATDLSISELAKLRSAFDQFQEVLQLPNAGVASDAYSTSTAVSVKVNDYSALQVADDLISVSQLARGQVLEFTGYTTANQSLSEGNLTVRFGSWSGTDFSETDSADAQTVSLSGTGATLGGLATQLNALAGVSARIVAKSDGNYSLLVITDPGVSNAVQITADVDDLAAFDTSDDNSEQVLSAQNAVFTYNGVSLSRSSNTIDDLIPGTTLTLNSTTDTDARVSVFEDADFAEGELTTYLEKLNALVSTMKSATARGINGAGSGPLVGDTAMAGVLRQLSRLTTTPLEGFGDAPIYLTTFGVQTERDGTFSIDSEKFAAAFSANPAGYRAIFDSLAQSSDSTITVTKKSSANPPIGEYSFVYTDSTTASLNGKSLIARTLNGRSTFYAITGDFAGVSFDVTDASTGTSSIYFGKSTLDQMSEYITSILSKSGDFTRLETSYSDTSLSQSDELTALSEKETMLADLYRAKFTAMEQQITKLKSTGSFLTSMTDALNAQSN